VSGSVLVVDVGTSSVRSSLVAVDGTVSETRQRAVLPSTPAPGLVEVDAVALATAALDTAREVLAATGPVDAVGVTNQRATTVVWDERTGVPVGPGIGWQDLRTVLDCLTLQAEGIRLSPNASATKLRWLVEHAAPEALAAGALRFGTVDTWIVRALSEGELHVTDATNAGVTGLVTDEVSSWDTAVLDALGVDLSMLPRIVDSSGVVGEATALRGAPRIAAVIGDQQASLAGQGCVAPGQAKLTFGSGGMLDLVLGDRPAFGSQRGDHGCFPIVARQRAGERTWGIEAVLLTAGTCVEWLRDELGLIERSADTDALAASVHDAAGVSFVPALLGVGTPDWDFGARGGFFGLTRGAGRAHLVRAVLEGIAQRGRDLVEAAEHDGQVTLPTLRVDGGMTANGTFLQCLADATGRAVEVAPVLEATTRGAGLLAHLGVGNLADEAALAATWHPSRTIEPARDEAAREAAREEWLRAKGQALRTIPSLSSVSF
jgi:glycerol kinase